MNAHEFFLVALPGLEDVVRHEALAWYPDLNFTPEHGGVRVETDLATGLGMNLCLKTPTRILLRLKTFRCRDFPKLYNVVLAFPWKDWVDPSCEIRVHAATRLSRLKIKKRIEEACEDAWMDYQKREKVTARRGQTLDLFVRLVKDDCTISVDTSGERLHKRGQRTLVGEAPLRETIAAALLRQVAEGSTNAKVIIADPMMGSGTFLVEAAGLEKPVDARDFAFEHFQAQAVSPKGPAKRFPRVVGLVGFEKDPKTFQAAGVNLKHQEARLSSEDIFAVAEPVAAEAPVWVFCNPPYGERLKVKEPLKELYARLFNQCEKIFRPHRACFLLPAKAVSGKFDLPLGWKVLEKRPFLNGGIPVVAFVFGRSDIDRPGV